MPPGLFILKGKPTMPKIRALREMAHAGQLHQPDDHFMASETDAGYYVQYGFAAHADEAAAAGVTPNAPDGSKPKGEARAMHTNDDGTLSPGADGPGNKALTPTADKSEPTKSTNADGELVDDGEKAGRRGYKRRDMSAE